MRNLIFIVIAFLSWPVKSEHLLFVADDYPPFIQKGQKDEGFFVEIIKAVVAEMGFDMTLKYYPWVRCEKMVARGKAFALFPYFRTKERDRRFDFSLPIHQVSYRAYYLLSNFPAGIHWNKLSDLKYFSIGGALGYWYIPVFQAQQLRFSMVLTDVDNFARLFDNKVDLVVADDVLAPSIIRRHFPGQTARVAGSKKSFKTDHYRLMVTKPAFRPEGSLAHFNAVFSRLQKTGAFKRIMEKYSLEHEIMLK